MTLNRPSDSPTVTAAEPSTHRRPWVQRPSNFLFLGGGSRGGGGPDADGPDADGPDADGPDADGPDADGPDGGGAGAGDRTALILFPLPFSLSGSV